MQSAAVACPFDILSPELRADPYGAYAILRREAPVCRLPFGPWLVTRHADCAALLSGDLCDHFGQDLRRHAGASPRERMLAEALHLLGPTHPAGLRRVVAESFAPDATQAIEAFVAGAAAERLRQARRSGRLELVGDYAAPLTLAMLADLLEADDATRLDLQDAFAAIGGDLFAALRAPGEPDQTGPAAATAEVVDALIAAGRRHGRGLIGRIAVAAPDLDDAQLHALSLLVMFAAHQNMVGFIGNAVVALAADPEAVARLPRGAPSPSAVLELLRYATPLQHMVVVARRGLELADQWIEAGETILVCIASANRDPAAWPDPDRLNFDRDTRAQLSFGAGPWRCLGARLAQSASAMLLAPLLAEGRPPRLAGPPLWESRGPFIHRGPRALLLDLTHD